MGRYCLHFFIISLFPPQIKLFKLIILNGKCNHGTAVGALRRVDLSLRLLWFRCRSLINLNKARLNIDKLQLAQYLRRRELLKWPKVPFKYLIPRTPGSKQNKTLFSVEELFVLLCLLQVSQDLIF